MAQHLLTECPTGNELSDLFDVAAEAADEILQSIYFVEIRKALNPLVPHDYIQIVKHLANELMNHVVPVEKSAMRKAVESLDVDWHNLNKEQRAHILNEAKKYLVPLPEQVLPKVEQTLAFAAKDIIANTKSKAVLKYDLKISPKLSEFDQRVSKVLRASQGNFIRDQFGKRIDSFSTNARDIVANGLEQGYGSKEIAAQLSEKLQQAGRGDGYWNMIAMVHANRARTMTQLGSFHEAGIVAFRVESVLDEVTSVQCRFMHGKTFPVQTGMKHFQEAENAVAAAPDDVNAIKLATPFLNHGGPPGEKTIYVPSGDDGRVNVASVLQSAVGEKDRVGSFGHSKDTDKLAALGISCPPFHGHCRTTIVPVFGEMSGRPAPPPPVSPRRPAKPAPAPPAPAAVPTEPRPAVAPAAPAPKPEHDPAFWLKQYAHLGESAATVAHGKASLERGLDTDVETLLSSLRGGPAWMESLRSEVTTLISSTRAGAAPGGSTLRELIAERARHGDGDPYHDQKMRAAAAVSGHMASVEPSGNLAVTAKIPRSNPNKDRAKELFGQTQQLFAKMLSKNVTSGSPVISWKAGVRAYATRVSILASFRPHVLEHEWGHVLEFSNPKLLDRAVAFLGGRTSGEPIRRLRDVIPGSGYAPGEVTRADKFRNPYVGKHYGGSSKPHATEVTSMGLEWLARESALFLEQDSEHFFFTLGQLAGE